MDADLEQAVESATHGNYSADVLVRRLRDEGYDVVKLLARTLCGGCYQAQQAGADPIKCVHKADLDIETGDHRHDRGAQDHGHGSPYDRGGWGPVEQWLDDGVSDDTHPGRNANG